MHYVSLLCFALVALTNNLCADALGDQKAEELRESQQRASDEAYQRKLDDDRYERQREDDRRWQQKQDARRH